MSIIVIAIEADAQDSIIRRPGVGTSMQEGATELGSVSELVSFVSPAGFEDTMEGMRSEFVGIGIQFYPYRAEYVSIARVLYGSPAAEAGVRSGDQIIAINGRPTHYVSPQEIVRRMAGDVGEPLAMTIRRPFGLVNREPEITVSLRRDIVYLPNLEEARILPGNIAYLRIISLLEHAPREVQGRIRDFLDEGATSLVIDLRWVNGGYLRSARDIAGLVMPPHTLMGYIRKSDANSGDGIAVFTESQPVVPDHIPVAILANAKTTGAAELLAAVAAASPRTLLIGQKTGGHANVDRSTSLLGLSNADLLREYLYTAEGEPIHRNGIAPEVDTQMTPNEENTLRMQMFESYYGDPGLENRQNHGRVSGNDPDEVAIEDRPLAEAAKWIRRQR